MDTERAFTKQQLQARLMLQGKRFWDSLAPAVPIGSMPGKVTRHGVLTVPLDDMKLYVEQQKALAAQTAIKAFLDVAFE